jgi:hypothetical protein
LDLTGFQKSVPIELNPGIHPGVSRISGSRDSSAKNSCTFGSGESLTAFRTILARPHHARFRSNVTLRIGFADRN